MKSSKDPSCQGRRYRRYFAGSPAWGSVPMSVALPNTAKSTPYPRCRRRKCHRRTHHYALQVKRPIVGDRGIIDQNQLRLQSELGLDPVSRRHGNHTAADRPPQLLAAKSRRCTRSVADVRNRVGSNDRSSRSWSSCADPLPTLPVIGSGHSRLRTGQSRFARNERRAPRRPSQVSWYRDQGCNSISPGRQVLLNHGSSGPYRRRIMNQPLPGIVCTQLFSMPAGALGPK